MHYPPFDIRMKTVGGNRLIFDNIRKIWLKLTPEEWVRQNFVLYLTEVMKYPSSLIALEKKIMVGELMRRFDILIYDPDFRPWMLVECKAMEIPLTPSVLDQVLRYNISVPVAYLVITNGNYCMPFKKANGTLEIMEDLPLFGEKAGNL